MGLSRRVLVAVLAGSVASSPFGSANEPPPSPTVSPPPNPTPPAMPAPPGDPCLPGGTATFCDDFDRAGSSQDVVSKWGAQGRDDILDIDTDGLSAPNAL